MSALNAARSPPHDAGLYQHRQQHRPRAQRALGAGGTTRALRRHPRSPIYETTAVGFEGDDFLNLVVGVDTELDPEALTVALKTIEHDHGRRGQGEGRCGARTLDLDLLLWGDAPATTGASICPATRSCATPSYCGRWRSSPASGATRNSGGPSPRCGRNSTPTISPCVGSSSRTPRERGTAAPRSGCPGPQ
ncbi:MAG: 2-amino-4-hydroxy-6-hydroxymethyldihydropteridine diphosphokinase [Arhodomonas sp.]|nr:2-amino-4-hydroxy-6-hydroxymethyldihydropteridine diphosphokinase [Arhodomonas sp.]